MFLKVFIDRYCFILDLQHFSFNVLADIYCLRSSMAVLKPLAYILYFLYFFFSSHFNLILPFFHRLLNQSSILLKSFLKTAISFYILRFQNGSFLFMVWPVLTPTFSQTNSAPAIAIYLRQIYYWDTFTTYSLYSHAWSPNVCLYYVGLEYLLLLHQSVAGE